MAQQLWRGQQLHAEAGIGCAEYMAGDAFVARVERGAKSGGSVHAHWKGSRGFRRTDSKVEIDYTALPAFGRDQLCRADCGFHGGVHAGSESRADTDSDPADTDFHGASGQRSAERTSRSRGGASGAGGGGGAGGTSPCRVADQSYA